MLAALRNVMHNFNHLVVPFITLSLNLGNKNESLSIPISSDYFKLLLLSCSKHFLEKLQKVKNSAARVVLDAKGRVSSLLRTLRWLHTHPVNMPDPIRIRSGSAWKYWPKAGRMIFANRICFRTGSVWPKPDSQPELNRIRAGFAQYDSRRLWLIATGSESGKLVAGALRPSRNRAR